MRTVEIVIGIILLGGAAWTVVKSYKGRGTSSVLVLAFAVFLVALGMLFVFGAFGAWFRDLRFWSVRWDNWRISLMICWKCPVSSPEGFNFIENAWR